MKIFINKFLSVAIPILKGSEDYFIRMGYFGGATDYYKCYCKGLYYYDINSLYPHAMCKPMPHFIKKFHKDLSVIKLEDFFGFCLAEIQTPNNLKPLLPYKYKGKTIYPNGIFTGVYFSLFFFLLFFFNKKKDK
uniref:DNA-directed DNA polymerase n=1 Tax=Myochromella boudieri TaxID=117066 RepID=A0A386TY53_9AGAR|nr:DNA polymerase [Myochromella boudieri]AYE93153.1 DNA polymerase [Myochromella boudieri]